MTRHDYKRIYAVDGLIQDYFCDARNIAQSLANDRQKDVVVVRYPCHRAAKKGLDGVVALVMKPKEAL